MNDLRDTTIRKVQVKLSRLSLYVLACLMVKCGKDEFGNLFRQQCLFAMSPSFDADRLSNEDSFNLLDSVGDDKWM